ncbi:MAG: Hpt domain-containing protein, partial [Hyphomonadaceae bacterium]
RTANYSDAALRALHVRAHDVKGLGSTYDYPFVTAIAQQLCRLLETVMTAREGLHLIDAHVDAIRAVVRSGLRGEHDATGRALVAELTTRVDRFAASE